MKIGKLTLRNGWKQFSAAILFCTLVAIASSAQTLTTLLHFDGTNGQDPSAVIQGYDGSFYGTTRLGGLNNSGTAFQLTSTGTLITLYSFCAETNCTDGKEPLNGLVRATNGNFYGTTSVGGQGFGTIFALTPKGKITQLYSFCQGLGCPDGNEPNGLVQVANGNLYGTAEFGGKYNHGTAFEMTPGGALTIVHTFHGGTDGINPAGSLIQAADENLYGIALSGTGALFQMTPTGTVTKLHSFGLVAGGYEPNQPIQSPDGSLFGTTVYGGVQNNQPCEGCGTVFRMSPTGKFTTLYTFCSQTNCADGLFPDAGLVLGSDGNFYGTTNYGGNANNAGTIFKITPQGVLTTIYTFCEQTDCTDGSYPEAALLQATDGDFYGTTSAGGTGGINGPGTVFRFSTGLGPFVKLARSSGKVGQTGGILGQGFTGTTGVFLNGTPATFAVVSDSVIEATIPAGATTGFITVATPAGTLTSNVVFRVQP